MFAGKSGGWGMWNSCVGVCVFFLLLLGVLFSWGTIGTLKITIGGQRSRKVVYDLLTKDAHHARLICMSPNTLAKKIYNFHTECEIWPRHTAVPIGLYRTRWQI